MKIFFKVFEVGVCVELFFQEVLDGFDIVIGHFLDFFHSETVLDRKLFEDLLKPGVLSFDALNRLGVLLNDILLEESFEPLKLNLNSVAH